MMLFVLVALLAQTPTIKPSQHGTVSQNVAATTITVDYNRPVARGRELFGSLVPYDRIWCPGADDCTIMEVSTKVTFEGQDLPAGKYSVWTEPGPEKWVVIFNKQANAFHTRYPAGQDALRLEVTPRTGSHMETLAFYFPAVDGHKGELALHWGTDGYAPVTDEQRRVAGLLTRSREIDLVYGHHAHVVQPLENVGGSDSDRYFSDGITDELTSALGKIPGLRVASRTSVFALRGKGMDAQQIAKTLKVSSVLEGTIRRSGDRLRVTAQLTNASDGLALWSDVYERQMKDVFAVQDDISGSIANALRVALAPAPAENGTNRGPPTRTALAGTEDLVAYDLYLRGRYFWHQRGNDALHRAADYFGQAIDRDPTFARAYAGLADVLGLLPIYGTTPADSAFPLARTAAERALQLDSTLAEAHTTLGLILKSTATLFAAMISGGATTTHVVMGMNIETWVILIMTVVFVSYGFAGGLRATVITETIQGPLIVIMSLLLLPFGIYKLGGFHVLHESLPDTFFHLASKSYEFTPQWVIASSMVALIGWVAQPGIVAAVGSGKTELEGRVGYTYGAMIKRVCAIGWTFVWRHSS